MPPSATVESKEYSSEAIARNRDTLTGRPAAYEHDHAATESA